MTVRELEEKIVELQKEVDKLKLQEEDEIYLLSIEEYEKYKNEIPQIRTSWWLRSPGDSSSYAGYVYFDGSVCNYGFYVHFDNYAVRPALKYENLKSEISESKKGNDYFVFNEIRWKIIDKEKKIAISELPIGFEKFDDESSNYEGSCIRQWLLNWKEQENE